MNEKGFEFVSEKFLEELDKSQRSPNEPNLVTVWQDDEDSECAYEGCIKVINVEKRKWMLLNQIGK